MSDVRAGAAEDLALITRCRNGDTRAWQQLIDKYARLVHFIPVRHGLTPQEVDDVGQEVFVALAQNINDIEQPERVSAWLSTTARRFSWRALQKRKREQPADTLDFSETPDDNVLFSRVPSISELLTDWANQEILQQGLSLLDNRCRELIYRLFLDPQERTYDDISQLLSIPKGSIGPTRTRCLQRLRERLSELGFHK